MNVISLVEQYFKGNQIASFVDEFGMMWFHGSQTCTALGYVNPRAVIANLDEDERQKIDIGRNTDVWYVNEPGIYNLILGSKKTEAKEFKRWLTHEILPSIRKTGIAIDESRFDVEEVERLKAVVAERDLRLKNILKPAKKLIDGYDYEFQQKRHMLVFGFFDTMHPIKYRNFSQVLSEIGRYGFVYDKERFSIALALFKERYNQELEKKGYDYQMVKIKMTDSTNIIRSTSLDMFFDCIYDSMREDGDIANIGTTSNMNKFQDIFGVKCGEHAEKDWSKHNNNYEYVKDLKESLEIE